MKKERKKKKERRYKMLMNIYKKKFLYGFNPESPTEEFMNAIAKVKTNGTSRLNPSTRNK